MNKEEFAKLLDGREYGNEISVEQEIKAKENNLIVIFGYSDDCVELRGAINDEVSAYDGTTIYFDGKELVDNAIVDDCQSCKLFQKLKKGFKAIEAVWGGGEHDCSWAFETDIPHAEFKIYEGDELYCVGIVISVDEVEDAD